MYGKFWTKPRRRNRRGRTRGGRAAVGSFNPQPFSHNHHPHTPIDCASELAQLRACVELKAELRSRLDKLCGVQNERTDKESRKSDVLAPDEAVSYVMTMVWLRQQFCLFVCCVVFEQNGR